MYGNVDQLKLDTKFFGIAKTLGIRNLTFFERYFVVEVFLDLMTDSGLSFKIDARCRIKVSQFLTQISLDLLTLAEQRKHCLKFIY